MSKPITVACQYVGKTPCGNRTTNPTGLCPKHRDSMPLKDIHDGKGAKPLMTAIPRVGPVLATERKYTQDDFTSNEAIAQTLADEEERVLAALAEERALAQEREKYGNPSLMTRLREPGKVAEWKARLKQEKRSGKSGGETSYQSAVDMNTQSALGYFD